MRTRRVRVGAVVALLAAVVALTAACSSKDAAAPSTTQPGASTSSTSPLTTLPPALRSTGDRLVHDYYANLTCSSQDAAAYSKLLAEQFLSVTGRGTKDRAGVLQALAGTCFESSSVSDVSVRQPVPDVLVVNYRARVGVKGARAAPASWRTNVFVRTDGSWHGVMFADTARVDGPAAAVPAPASTDVQQLGQLVQQTFTQQLPCAAGNQQAYAKLVADSFESVGPSGATSADAIRSILVQVCQSHPATTLSDLVVRRTGPVLVVTYTATTQLPPGDAGEAAPAPTTARGATVFVDDAGTWKAAESVDLGQVAG